MEQKSLHFIVVNDAEHDFDLMMEVSMGTDSRSIADIRRVSGIWFITFFCQGGQLELNGKRSRPYLRDSLILCKKWIVLAIARRIEAGNVCSRISAQAATAFGNTTVQ